MGVLCGSGSGLYSTSNCLEWLRKTTKISYMIAIIRLVIESGTFRMWSQRSDHSPLRCYRLCELQNQRVFKCGVGFIKSTCWPSLLNAYRLSWYYVLWRWQVSSRIPLDCCFSFRQSWFYGNLDVHDSRRKAVRSEFQRAGCRWALTTHTMVVCDAFLPNWKKWWLNQSSIMRPGHRLEAEKRT